MSSRCRLTLPVAALVAVISLAACTTSRPPAVKSAPPSAGSDPVASEPGSPPSGAPTSQASGATGQDGRADPGAFASSLDFTDISSQVNSALKQSDDTPSQPLSFARATMTVPLDWAHAGNGKTVQLTVLRVRANNQHNRIGSLVINPGGPGASGTEAALEIAVDELPAAILDRFDIVGFDPRGVELSDPLECIPASEKDAELNTPTDPLSQADWNAAVAESTKVADECYAKYGNDLTYYSTAQTVRDLEALRAKLGDAKLSYLGYSYGTLLGAEYASAYPTKVRALVLDGAVDPTISTTAQDQAQAAGFSLAFSHYAANCQQQGPCKLGADPMEFVTSLMAKADAHPIPSGDSSDKRVAKDGAVGLAVLSALYDESEWPTLTQALLDAANGKAEGVLELDDQYTERQTDGSYTNIEDANLAISCADTTDRPTVAQARALQAQWEKASPLFGGSEAAGLFSCSLWKAPPDAPIKVTDAGAPTILVVGTTGDPATPISGARHMASLLGSGDLLVWNGDGHTAYPKTTCITNDVDSYLIDLRAPAAGTTCPAS